MKPNNIRILGTALALSSVLSVQAKAADTPLLQFEGQALHAVRDGDTICAGFRDFCEAIGYQVSWVDGTAIAEGEMTVTARPGDCSIRVGDTIHSTQSEIRLIDDRTVLPLRDLARALRMEVRYDAATGSATICMPQQTPPIESVTPDIEFQPEPEFTPGLESKPEAKPPVSPEMPPETSPDEEITAPSYDESDLYWLARIIEAEAGAEGMDGKIAVGNVVLNRVDHANYPDTIYDVIFDTQYGTQFEPTANGTVYNAPSQESIEAARRALEGENVAGNALFFYNPSLVDAVWIRTNCTYLQTIGCHAFYV